MRNALLIFITVSAALIFTSCSMFESAESTDQENSQAISENPKISSDEAKLLIFEHHRTILPFLFSYMGGSGLAGGGSGFGGGGYSGGYGGGGFAGGGLPISKIAEKTTDEIWQKFHVQIFTMYNMTYFIRDKIFMYVIDSALKDYVITDLDKNSIPEIVFIGTQKTYDSSHEYVSYFLKAYSEDRAFANLINNNQELKYCQPKDITILDDSTLAIIKDQDVLTISAQHEDNKTSIVVNKVKIVGEDVK